ncbi:E3 ubiquitin-protein ligase TRIM65-like [Aplochiton taeniatus]
MAEAIFYPDQVDCPICLERLQDPVTIPCGHSYCMGCIEVCWHQKDQQGLYSCPLCRKRFGHRPALETNSVLAEVVERLRNTGLRAKLGRQEVQRRVQERKRKLREIQQAVETLKHSAQAAVEDSERLFGQLLHYIERRHCEVKELIRVQQGAVLHQAEGVMERLALELDELGSEDTELGPEDAELGRLLRSRRHSHSHQSVWVSPGFGGDRPFSVNAWPSYECVRKQVSELTQRLKEVCRAELDHISVTAFGNPPAADACALTLDGSTAHRQLSLSEGNRKVTQSLAHVSTDSGPSRPERFQDCEQVLCCEALCGRCYWEADWSGIWAGIGVAYRGISRAGEDDSSGLGCNGLSWSLDVSKDRYSALHKGTRTAVRVPASRSHKVGVYLDWSAGTLSFYSVSFDTMVHLHTFHATFTEPLYPGFRVEYSVSLCDVKGTHTA